MILVIQPRSHKRLLKCYYNEKNEKFLIENFVTHNILLRWKNKEYFFDSLIDFYEFFLKEGNFETSNFLFNSLLRVPSIINKTGNNGKDYLYWQGEIDDNILRHIMHNLNRPNRDLKVIVPNEKIHSQLAYKLEEQKNVVIKGGYVYKFKKNNSYSNQILCLTNSDQVLYLEQLAQSNPQYDFHIAALTTMSNKLLTLNKYSNIHLYPNVIKKKVIELYEECDIYLDINKGKKILDSVRAAFDYNLLILAEKEITHNSDVTAPNNIITSNNEKEFSSILKEIYNNKEKFKNRLIYQHKHAGAMSPSEFKKIFKK